MVLSNSQLDEIQNRNMIERMRESEIRMYQNCDKKNRFNNPLSEKLPKTVTNSFDRR